MGKECYGQLNDNKYFACSVFSIDEGTLCSNAGVFVAGYERYAIIKVQVIQFRFTEKRR